MNLSRLLATTNHALTTDAAAITAPTDLPSKSAVIVVCCTSSGEFVTWRRQAASDSTYSTLCLDSKESIPLAVSAGNTPFYAKMASGTGTLEVEWWG